MRLWTMLLVVNVVGCVSARTSPETLIVPWSEELAYGEAPLPFLAKYSRQEKAIYYLAAEHSNKMSSPTFRMFQEFSQKFPAELFLVEGFETEKGYSPQDIKDWAMSDGANGHYSGGEPAYVVQMALRKKVPFLGLEPSEKEIYAALQKEKFTAQDIANYYFVRQVPQWRRAGTLEKGRIESTYARFVTGAGKKLGAEVSSDYSAFLKWYKSKNKEEFSALSLDSEKAAPYIQGPYFTQRIAAAIGMIRDRHMILLLEKELASKNRIFVVVGGSHWMTQKLALEAISGFPGFEFKQN